MSVIRLYDNRMFLHNELRKGKVFQGLVSQDVCVEYCTLASIDDEYKSMTYCYKQNEEGKCVVQKRLGWDMNREDHYYVFLDTLWEELLDKQQIYGVPKELLESDFKDPRVVSLTVYSVFDFSAAQVLHRKIVEYRDNHPDIYFPIIREPVFIWYDDDKKNLEIFRAPIIEE